MNKKIIVLLSGMVICAGALAVVGKKTYVVSKDINQNIGRQQQKTAGLRIEDSPQEELVNKVISKMSSRAQSAIKINNIDEFLTGLDKVLACNATDTENDIPLLKLVDKKHPLSQGYEPKNLLTLIKNNDLALSRENLSLRFEAYNALQILAKAARKDGIKLLISSTYRSYSYQKKVYEKWVKIDGQEEADRESARPGTSQHQLGTAVDFGSISDDFATTPMGKWMYKHAAEYGWSLSFPEGYEDVTGYRWECWHFRYIGKEACQ
ncbi:MAG: M15 family metallopeptidase, partial [Treponema sp.]|nr:M15 family metallopeptidase [Treponema sp.]